MMPDPDFRKYLEDVFGPEGAGKVLTALECPPSVSVRLNPSKTDARSGDMPEIAGVETGGKVPWCERGYFLKERPVFTLDPLIHAGAYYVQDSSSMFVGHVFRQMLERRPAEGALPPWRNVRVLDLCAAPGGKTTDLSSSLREALGDRFILVSNEVMKGRAGILADNVALWGDPNVVVTSADPSAFARLAGFFDIVLADVPCSGEGMFRKDEKAVEQWSAETVSLCAARQRRILADVWPALAPGGFLIYSTCTFNRYENDDNVGWAASELGAGVQAPYCPYEGPVRTEHGYSLAPGFVQGEGQYCAVLRKNEDGSRNVSAMEAAGKTPDRMRRGSVGTKSMEKSRTISSGTSAIPVKELAGMFSTEVSFRDRNGLMTAVPQQIEDDLAAVEKSLKPLLAGVAVGTMKAGKLIPSADLALSTILREDAFPNAELDKKVALEFLHRDTIRLEDSPLGYITVSYKGIRLGFVKNIGNRCNNLHPMSRRIIMNLRDK